MKIVAMRASGSASSDHRPARAGDASAQRTDPRCRDRNVGPTLDPASATSENPAELPAAGATTMASQHTVVQGEHLSRIATQYGFSDYRTIWEHPQNASLRQKRVNPNVLFPGDQLYIPDRKEREENRPTDQRHRFVLRAPRLKLKLVLDDIYEKPIANAPCELHVEGEVHRLSTDGSGRIEKDIPNAAEQARLIIRSPETALDEFVLPIVIGHLDPVEEDTGQKARLANLGYYLGEIDDRADPTFRMAVEEFQCDQRLAVDGVCGPQTQARLKQVHGC
jgi:hypothetical protein